MKQAVLATPAADTSCSTTFSDGRARRTLLVLQPDLLQRHQVVGQLAAALEHGGVRPLHQEGAVAQRLATKANDRTVSAGGAHLSQLVQLDVGLQFAEPDLRLDETQRRSINRHH